MTTHLPAPPAPRRYLPGPDRARRLALGPPDEPRWTRPALWAVLLLATALYAWQLWKGGYGNSYYAAAVKSGTQSWKAFFFGSLDSASFITVDKPPMALWAQELTARVIGFGTWSLLLPQVIFGVATVAVLYATVRRAFGPVAGVIAALVMTLTPITVAINRDNNPDTLLVFFLVLAAWAGQRALESGRLRWLAGAAFFLGCGFNTKMLQAFILLPALALVYLLFAPGGWLRRIGHLLAAGAALAVSALWWTLAVDLTPAGSRPYIGGSTDGTAWNLIVGYNGIGRIAGQGGHGGGPGGGGGGMPAGGPGFSGQSGIGRMFNETLGGQISWLLPFTAVALVAGLILYRRRSRTDLARAALVLWGGWLVTHFLVFSFASGIMHPYYTTAMAPAIAALTGVGAVELLRHRNDPVWGLILPVAVAGTGGWAFVLLRRTPHWHPWLAWTVIGATTVAVLGLLAVRFGAGRVSGLTAVAVGAALVTGLTGPAAYAVSASGHSSNGGDPTAGPNSGGMGGFGRLPANLRAWIERYAGGAFPPGTMPAGGAPEGMPGGQMPPGMPGGGMPGAMPGGGPGGSGQAMPGGPPAGSGGQAPGNTGGIPEGTGAAPGDGTANGTGAPRGGGEAGRRPGDRQGGMSGRTSMFGMGEVSAKLVAYLKAHRDGATWLVAVSNSMSAASIILQSGRPAISMFGFIGGDRAMTVAKLQRLVRDGRLHYVLTGMGSPGGGGPGNPFGGGNAGSEVTTWVTKNCTAVPTSAYGETSSTTGTSGTGQKTGSSLYRCG